MGGVHTRLVYYLFIGGVRTIPVRLVSITIYLDLDTAMALAIIINNVFRPDTIQWGEIILIASGLLLPLIRQTG